MINFAALPTSSIKEVSEEVKPSQAESLEIELPSESKAQVQFLTTAPEHIPAEITLTAENSMALDICISEYEKQRLSERIELHPIKAIEVTEIITISKEQQIKAEIVTVEEAEVKSVSEHVMFAPAEEIETAIDLVADQLVRQELEETTLHLSKELLMVYLAETISHTTAETEGQTKVEETHEETIETATVDYDISQIAATGHSEILQTAGKIFKQTKGHAERVVTITDLRQLQKMSPVREAIAELMTSEVVETTEYVSHGMTREIEESCEATVHATRGESISLNVPLVTKKKRMSIGENVNATITVERPESKGKKSVTFGMVPLETEEATIYLSREAYEEVRVKVQVENPTVTELAELNFVEITKDKAKLSVQTTKTQEVTVIMDVELVHMPEIALSDITVSSTEKDAAKLFFVETQQQQSFISLDQTFSGKILSESDELFIQPSTMQRYEMSERTIIFQAAFEERMDTVLITLPAHVTETTDLIITREELEISERSKESFSEVSVSISEDISVASTLSEHAEELHKTIDLTFEQLQKLGVEALLGLEKSKAHLSVKHEKKATILSEVKTDISQKEVVESAQAIISEEAVTTAKQIIPLQPVPVEEISIDVAQETTNFSTTEIILDEKPFQKASFKLLRKGTVETASEIILSQSEGTSIIEIVLATTVTEAVGAIIKVDRRIEKLEEIVIEEVETVTVQEITTVEKLVVEDKIAQESSTLVAGIEKTSITEAAEEEILSKVKQLQTTSKTVSLDKTKTVEEIEEDIHISSDSVVSQVETVFGIKESEQLEKRASFLEEKATSSVSFINQEPTLSFDVALAQLISESVRQEVEKIYRDEREGAEIIFQHTESHYIEELTINFNERASVKENIYHVKPIETVTDVMHAISGQSETVELLQSVPQFESTEKQVRITVEKEDESIVDIDILKPEDEDKLDILLSLIPEEEAKQTIGAEALYIDVNIEKKSEELSAEVNIEPTTGKVEGALEEQSINVDVDVAIPEDSFEVELLFVELQKEETSIKIGHLLSNIEVSKVESAEEDTVDLVTKPSDKISKFISHEEALVIELDVECIRPEDEVGLDIQLILIESEDAKLDLVRRGSMRRKMPINFSYNFFILQCQYKNFRAGN